MSEDTGNVKFVQNYNREIFLEKSLFWVEEPGCSSRTQNPAHQSADFSAKQGVTPGGNYLELFLGQSWVSSQKMGSVSRKTKNATFLHFIEISEIIQRGDPWYQKNSKFSNLDETCRTGGDHQKNKLGSDFEVFLHLVALWGIKNPSFRNQKWRILEKKKHQKWRIGSLFWTKSSLLRRKPPKVEVFQVFCNQKWRILRKKAPKVEDFVPK